MTSWDEDDERHERHKERMIELRAEVDDLEAQVTNLRVNAARDAVLTEQAMVALREQTAELVVIDRVQGGSVAKLWDEFQAHRTTPGPHRPTEEDTD